MLPTHCIFMGTRGLVLILCTYIFHCSVMTTCVTDGSHFLSTVSLILYALFDNTPELLIFFFVLLLKSDVIIRSRDLCRDIFEPLLFNVIESDDF